MSEENRRNILRKKENRMARRIVSYVIIAFLTVVVIAGVSITAYWKNGQKPLAPDNNKTKLVEIPLGSSNKQIASILEDKSIIRSKEVFHYYMKLHNQSDFQAGFYKLAPSMTLDHLAEIFKEGKSEKQALTIPEGYNIDEIAASLEKKTPFKKDDFLKLMKDQNFFKEMVKEFPEMLDSAAKAKDVRYPLEGYLFPATYDITPGGDLKDLVYQLLNKEDQVLSAYYEDIKNQGMTVHEVITLASLVEKEGVKENDRKQIAGVFFNRLNVDMPLQSDVAIHYAKGEYKEKVSIKDTQIDSPYNLYVHTGYGPGPYNSPSESAIEAVLHPAQTDYYYFVADIKTGMVYFSSTLDEHNVLVDKYVNNN